MRVRGIPEAVAVATVLAVAVVALVVTVAAERASNRVARWEAVAGGVQANIAVGHVWLEERLTGDRTVSVRRDIYGNFDRARARCRVLRDGGRSPDGASVVAVDDPTLRAEVVRQCGQLDTLRALTARRLALRSLPGSPADQQYDAEFGRALTLAEALPRRTRQLSDREEGRVTLTEIGAVTVLGSALLLAAALIRRRQRQLEDLAREREVVLDSAGEGILAIDDDGTIRFANTAAAVILGWTSSDLTGRSVDSLLPDGGANGDGNGARWFRPGFADATPQLLRRDGSSFPIEYTATSAHEGPERGTVVLTFRDITTRLRREVERDAELAELRAMRATLVPAELPDRDDVDLAKCFVAAKSGVSGDFYLVTDGPGDATVVIVGDVAGKGVAAAQCAAFVRTSLATFAPYTQSPSRLLDLANRALVERGHDYEMLATAACAVIQPGADRVTWALAGHAPPVRLDDGTPMLAKPGLPLGLEAETGATDATAPLPPGAGFVMFTDGLYEARAGDPTEDPAASHFGLQRIGDLIAGLGPAEPGDVVNALRTTAERFSNGSFADDLCIIAARTHSQRS